MGDSKVVTARKKVLVTGGAGYIGAHTAVALHESGFQPVLVDNFSKSDRTLLHGLSRLMGTSPQFYEGDCKDKHFLKKVFEKEIDITAVMHFAAYKSVAESVEKPVMYYHNNINSLLSLLEAARLHNLAGDRGKLARPQIIVHVVEAVAIGEIGEIRVFNARVEVFDVEGGNRQPVGTAA